MLAHEMVEKKGVLAQNFGESRIWFEHTEKSLQQFKAGVVSVTYIVFFPVNLDDCCTDPIQDTVHSMLECQLVLETCYCNLCDWFLRINQWNERKWYPERQNYSEEDLTDRKVLTRLKSGHKYQKAGYNAT
jgi:hypothetical protein